MMAFALFILCLIHGAAAVATTSSNPNRDHEIFNNRDVWDRIWASIPLEQMAASVYNSMSLDHVRPRRLFDPTCRDTSVAGTVLALDAYHAADIRHRIGWTEALYITRRVVTSGEPSAKIVEMLRHLIDGLGFTKVRDVSPGVLLHCKFLNATLKAEILRAMPPHQRLNLSSLPPSITDAVAQAINDAAVSSFFQKLSQITATNVLTADGEQIPGLLGIIDQWNQNPDFIHDDDWRYKFVLALDRHIRGSGTAGSQLRNDVRECLKALWAVLPAKVAGFGFKFWQLSTKIRYGYHAVSATDLVTAVQDSVSEQPHMLQKPVADWLPEPFCRIYDDPQQVSKLLLERLPADAVTDFNILLQLRLGGVAFDLKQYAKLPKDSFDIAQVVPLLNLYGHFTAFDFLNELILENRVDDVHVLSRIADFTMNVQCSGYLPYYFLIFAHLIFDRHTDMFRALASFHGTTKCFAFSYIDAEANGNLLHLAAHHDQEEIVEILLDHQPDLVMETDESDRTPLDYAQPGSGTYRLIEKVRRSPDMQGRTRPVAKHPHYLFRTYPNQSSAGLSSTAAFLTSSQ